VKLTFNNIPFEWSIVQKQQYKNIFEGELSENQTKTE
jgi:hypothetical protein